MVGRELSTTPNQYDLPLQIEKEIEVEGVRMGVLTDGTPYLTARGLARMCGVDHTKILQIGANWSPDSRKPRERRIAEILESQGIFLDSPFIPLMVDGSIHHAYTDVVCMAVLEYYAFEGKGSDSQIALRNYRLLARKSLRDFIYTQVGYDPSNFMPQVWRQFHDRVALVYDNVPHGYFSIFKEVADIIVTLIRSGARVGPEFVPDISMGRRWSDHWSVKGLSAKFGERIRYKHDYPNYFPQAASNPQTPFCYPDAALGEFRRWMREEYLVKAFPDYLKSKQRSGELPASFAELALSAIRERTPKALR